MMHFQGSVDTVARHGFTAVGRSNRLVADGDVDPFAPKWTGHNFPPSLAPTVLGHPAFQRLMDRLPDTRRQSFTDEQLVALSLASVPVNSPHVIDYRVSIPFFGKRFYVTLLAGREQRSLARLAAEGQLRFSRMWQLNATILAALASLAMVAAVIALFIIKSAFGIVLYEGDSSMHEIFRALSEQQSF